jgi:hypothetical protein
MEETMSHKFFHNLTSVSIIVGFILSSGLALAADKILVLMPDASGANDAFIGLTEEAGEDLDVVKEFVTRKTSVDDLKEIFSKTNPAAVVLMNNLIVVLYRNYQKSLGPDAKFPPALMMMASFLGQTSEGVRNATGISYEINGVTCFVNLRQIIDQPVKRIGVLYHPRFEKFIGEQRKLAALEEIDLVPVRVKQSKLSKSVKKGLNRLLKDEEVDALWVLNDNALLSKDVIVKSWLPVLKRVEKPVVVSVSSLVSTKFRFGSFAVLPDHTAMGQQAANLLFELQDSDWEVGDRGIEEPLAVEKIILLPFAKKYLSLKENALSLIDRAIE